MTKKGWFREPARHSLAAKGIKTYKKSVKHAMSPFKSYHGIRSDMSWMEKEMLAGRKIQKPESRLNRRRYEGIAAQVVSQDMDSERQFQRDLGDEDFIDARYDLSDPESDASIDREMREEGRAEGEADFWSEALCKHYEGKDAFEEWLHDIYPEARNEVRRKVKEQAHDDALEEEGWEWENGTGYVPPEKWEKYMKTDSKSVYAARRRDGWSDASARNHVRRFAYWEIDIERAREDWPLPIPRG